MEKTSDPYNYPFPKKQDTMYLSTISNSSNDSAKNDFKPTTTQYHKDSSFQKRDINGANPKILIPPKPNDTTFSLSTFVEPIPDRFKKLQKVSDPLYRDDIEGAKPKKNQFSTKRVVDPLCPKYQLPSAAEISVDPGKNFLRDGLEVADINQKRKSNIGDRGRNIVNDPIPGSQPAKLTKLIKAHSNLEVMDINKDGTFETKRTGDPLNPKYQWRDEDDKALNNNYGKINGSNPKQMHPTKINKPNNYCLDLNDIEGTKTGSCFSKAHFLEKRRQFRNYMVTQDIDKAQSSTLKKGIDTIRQTNPLMPSYQYPGNKEVQ